MPQLSLYIDEHTLKRVETAAKIENLSISRYVVKKLNESMADSWPENYENLFGSVTDDSFDRAPAEGFSRDASRENI